MEGEAHLTTPVEASGTATGRIDFCGGVADYSGSLVLEAPTTVSTTVNVRRTYNTRDVMLSSAAFGELAVPGYLDYLAAQEGVELKRVGEWLKAADVPGWGFYVLGSIAAFYKECGWLPEAGRGLELQVISGVPAGMGVSSSASLEVATIRALIAISGKNIPDVRVAHLAQAAENHVVGAPCGLMDQLACAVGVKGKLLPIVCRPDICSEPVALPKGVVIAGWPSGVEHQLAGESPYLIARTATFMAQAMADKILGRKTSCPTDISNFEFRNKVVPQLPVSISGTDFLREYGPLADEMSSLKPESSYNVAAALRFAVEENQRCHTILALLRGLESGGASHEAMTLECIGEWLLQAHVCYNEIGLGCEETDQMVEAVMALGPAQGVYGARVSGGGSGGTVVVLMQEAAVPQVEKLAQGLTFGKEFPGFVF